MKHETTHKMLLMVLAVVVSALTSVKIAAQSAGETDLDDGEIVTVNTRLVTVTARPKGSGGRNLSAQSLRVFADDAPQQIAFAEQAGAASVSLLVDLSRSMEREPAKRLPYAVEELVRESDPRNEYTLIVFNDTVRVLGTFKGDAAGRRQLLDALARQTFGGTTALYDAILEARKLAASAPSRNKRALVVLTDAQDTASRARLEDLRSGLDSIGGLTFVVVMSQTFAVDPHRHDAPLPDPKLFEVARQFRDSLDGDAYAVRTRRCISDAAGRIARSLRDAVQLAFYPTPRAAASGVHYLRVESSERGVSLSARSRYVIE